MFSLGSVPYTNPRTLFPFSVLDFAANESCAFNASSPPHQFPLTPSVLRSKPKKFSAFCSECVPHPPPYEGSFLQPALFFLSGPTFLILFVVFCARFHLIAFKIPKAGFPSPSFVVCRFSLGCLYPITILSLPPFAARKTPPLKDSPSPPP